VLNEIRKNDNTSWVWNKVRVNLKELARKIERNLAEYNVEGIGSTVIADGYWNCFYRRIGRLAGIGDCSAACLTCIGSEGGGHL